MSYPIPTKLAKVNRIENRCKSAHKYRRFTLKNKTYRTDRYFCADCGHNILIEKFFGIMTKCWRCNQAFSIKPERNGNLPIYPKCDNCKEIIKNRKNGSKTNSTNPPDDITLDFLESSVESEIEDSSKSEVNDKGIDLLKELGLI